MHFLEKLNGKKNYTGYLLETFLLYLENHLNQAYIGKLLCKYFNVIILSCIFSLMVNANVFCQFKSLAGHGFLKESVREGD